MKHCGKISQIFARSQNPLIAVNQPTKLVGFVLKDQFAQHKKEIKKKIKHSLSSPSCPWKVF